MLAQPKRNPVFHNARPQKRARHAGSVVDDPSTGRVGADAGPDGLQDTLANVARNGRIGDAHNIVTDDPRD